MCMSPVPRNGINPKVAKKRKMCFETARGATHDPLVSNPFGLRPHLYNKEDKERKDRLKKPKSLTKEEEISVRQKQLLFGDYDMQMSAAHA